MVMKEGKWACVTCQGLAWDWHIVMASFYWPKQVSKLKVMGGEMYSSLVVEGSCGKYREG